MSASGFGPGESKCRGVQIRQDTGGIAVIIKNARHSFSARKMNQGYPEYAEMFGAL